MVQTCLLLDAITNEKTEIDTNTLVSTQRQAPKRSNNSGEHTLLSPYISCYDLR